MKLTLLVDNQAPDDLTMEHGFSAWMEAGGQRLLFDTGQGSALDDNAAKLHVSLDATDTLILSHGHYDHTGGLAAVLARAPAAHLHCHPAVRVRRYVIRQGRVKPIGMPDRAKEAIENAPQRNVHWTTKPTEVAEGIHITGPIPRRTDFEDTGGPFFLDTGGTQEDPLYDDMALWADTPEGLVVLVGCSHAGIVNTLNHIRTLSGTHEIHAVIGGFHLVESNGNRVERTVHALQALDPDLIVPCHCTGETPTAILKHAFKDRCLVGHAGATFQF